MKKIMLISLAILLMGSLAFGHQLSSDPAGNMTSQFPAVYIDVYSASALDAGDVVVWAINDSTGDNDAWVESTTSADTTIVAGVIWPNAIVAAGTGSMVIYGMAECDTSALGIAAAGSLCTSTTAGGGEHCNTGTANAQYAIATETIATQGKCFVNTN